MKFVGLIARNPPEELPPRGQVRPGSDEWFAISKKMLRPMLDNIKGLPIKIEHDAFSEGKSDTPLVVGHATRGWFAPNGDAMVEIELRDDAVGQCTEWQIKKGFRGLSLTHNRLTNQPVEISLCRKPARDGCYIQGPVKVATPPPNPYEVAIPDGATKTNSPGHTAQCATPERAQETVLVQASFKAYIPADQVQASGVMSTPAAPATPQLSEAELDAQLAKAQQEAAQTNAALAQAAQGQTTNPQVPPNSTGGGRLTLSHDDFEKLATALAPRLQQQQQQQQQQVVPPTEEKKDDPASTGQKETFLEQKKRERSEAQAATPAADTEDAPSAKRVRGEAATEEYKTPLEQIIYSSGPIPAARKEALMDYELQRQREVNELKTQVAQNQSTTRALQQLFKSSMGAMMDVDEETQRQLDMAMNTPGGSAMAAALTPVMVQASFKNRLAKRGQTEDQLVDQTNQLVDRLSSPAVARQAKMQEKMQLLRQLQAENNAKREQLSQLQNNSIFNSPATAMVGQLGSQAFSQMNSALNPGQQQQQIPQGQLTPQQAAFMQQQLAAYQKQQEQQQQAMTGSVGMNPTTMQAGQVPVNVQASGRNATSQVDEMEELFNSVGDGIMVPVGQIGADIQRANKAAGYYVGP